MDIFAHSLWTAAAARQANKNKKLLLKNRAPLHVGWAVFWGVFPDLFAFGLPFLAMLYFFVTGQVTLSGIGLRHLFNAPSNARWIITLPAQLYQISHSLVTFSLVFLVVWLILRRPYWELLGWALHIFIDIPSHAANFYPTPFLWPISKYHFIYGVSWANPWFMLINYGALAIVWIYFLTKRKNPA